MTVQCLNGFSHKICIAHYLFLFELEFQRVEIVDVLIVGESWRDHKEKNEKRFLHLAHDAIFMH
jgi:hypothetical protein